MSNFIQKTRIRRQEARNEILYKELNQERLRNRGLTLENTALKQQLEKYKTPNKETQEAIQELREGKGILYENVEQLLNV